MLDSLLSSPVLFAFAVTVVAALSTMVGFLVIIRAVPTNPRLLSFGLSFAGGAMVYISLVEILDKSRQEFEMVLPADMVEITVTMFFFIGVLLLISMDRFIPHPHSRLEGTCCQSKSCCCTPDEQCHMRSVGLLTAGAITLHNLPEGMATFYATLENPVMGMPLAFAIMIHNIPEGISIAVPVFCATGSRKKAFIACLLSALAEPLGALISYIVLSDYLGSYTFGAIFGIIAGAMVFLALHELLPSAKRYATGHETVYGMVLGMAIMALSLSLFV